MYYTVYQLNTRAKIQIKNSSQHIVLVLKQTAILLAVRERGMSFCMAIY